MTKLKELEKVGRQAWLATIGTYAKGWEILSGKVDETFEETNQLIEELVENGEKIESTLKNKLTNNTLFDNKILQLKINLGVETSYEDKLVELSRQVDILTVEIEKLITVKAAETLKEKSVEKKTLAKRSEVKKVSATEQTLLPTKPTRTRRSTTHSKAAETK